MYVLQLKYTVAKQGHKWMLAFYRKSVYFVFKKPRTTAYLSVCMHVVATLLDIK
jgi:hypothetical protein